MFNAEEFVILFELRMLFLTQKSGSRKADRVGNYIKHYSYMKKLFSIVALMLLTISTNATNIPEVEYSKSFDIVAKSLNVESLEIAFEDCLSCTWTEYDSALNAVRTVKVYRNGDGQYYKRSTEYHSNGLTTVDPPVFFDTSNDAWNACVENVPLFLGLPDCF